VRAARRYVADRLTGWGMDTLVDTATLLVSEVVTNSVLHGKTVSFTMILGADPWRAFEMSDWESVEG